MPSARRSSRGGRSGPSRSSGDSPPYWQGIERALSDSSAVSGNRPKRTPFPVNGYQEAAERRESFVGLSAPTAALFDATLKGDVAAARRSIEAGADVLALHPGIYESNPLHCTAHYGNVAMTRLLLEHGANPHERNDFGLTPWGCAVIERKAGRALTRLFDDAGVDTSPRQFLRCYVNHANAGFFCQVQLVLHQCLLARRLGLEPVAHIGRDSLDGPNGYFCAATGTNVWEYFFEPIGGVRYADVWATLATDPGTQLMQATSQEVWRLHAWERASIFTYPYGCSKVAPGTSDEALERWYGEMRARGAKAVSEFVRVKPHITAKVDAFVARHFAPHMLGCHLRGTDKSDLGAGALARILPPHEYFADVDAFLEEHPDGKVFVATDQRQFREQMVAQYGKRVVHYDAVVMAGNVNAFQEAQADAEAGGDDLRAYRKGEDVLIDCLQRARIDAAPTLDP